MKKTRNTLTAYLLILALTITATLVTLTRTDAQPPSFSKGTYKVGVGYKVTLKLNGTDGKSVNWKISKKARKYVKVVKMTSKSLILKGRKTGKINVTANVGGRLIRAKVHIKKKYVALSDKRLYLKAGQRTGISITGTRKVSWRSSNKKVCTVYRKSKTEAVITAKNSGTAYVIAKAGKKTYKCRVKVTGKSGSNSNSGNSGKKKDNKKKKNTDNKLPRYEKRKYTTGTVTRVNFKKGDISVKITPLLVNKKLEKEYRDYFKIPEDVKLYDRIQVSFTNNLNLNNVQFPFEAYSFGTKYCLTKYQGGYTAKRMLTKGSGIWVLSNEDVNKERSFDHITLKKKQTKTFTLVSHGTGVKFISFDKNEPVQINLTSCSAELNPTVGLSFVYFPETGKMIKTYMKDYKYQPGAFPEYHYFRIRGSKAEYPN